VEQRTTILQLVHGAVTRRQQHLSLTSITHIIPTTPTITPTIIPVLLVTPAVDQTQVLRPPKPPLRTLATPPHPPQWCFILISTQLSTRTKSTSIFTAVHPQATCTGVQRRDRHWETRYSVTTTRMTTRQI
jgi:hypothetical protein